MIDLDQEHVRSIGIRGTHSRAGGFLRKTVNLRFWRPANGLFFFTPTDLKMVASLPILSPGKLAFTRDGSMAYAPVMHSSSIAVIQIVIPSRRYPYLLVQRIVIHAPCSASRLFPGFYNAMDSGAVTSRFTNARTDQKLCKPKYDPTGVCICRITSPSTAPAKE